MLFFKNGTALYRPFLRSHIPSVALLPFPSRIVSSSCQSHSRGLTTTPNEVIEYNWIDGVERLERYAPGGYHPVMIGDVLRGHYRIVDKLGFGGYSTIWLAHDDRSQRYVGIKVGISSQPSTHHESIILRDLSSSMSHGSRIPTDGSDAIPGILDEFTVEGPNGTHPCYTVIPAQGNLKEASFSRLFPIQVARALAAKLTMAVALVHSRGFVHADIHLRNVLVKLPSTFDEISIEQFRQEYGEPETVPITRTDGKPLSANVPIAAVMPLYLGKKAQEFTMDDARGLILSDFGESFAPATDRRLGKNCNTPIAKKAPEGLFEPNVPLSYPSDIWSLATAIWEILGMKFIFSESKTVDEIVAQQMDLLGAQGFPASWRREWERSTRGEPNTYEALPRKPTGEREKWPPLQEAFEQFVQKYRRKQEKTAGTFNEEETGAILELMRGMLKFRPEERMTIEDVLKSDWMVKWALRQLD